jgi:glycerate kinase
MGPELEQLQLAPGAGAAGGLGFAALVLGGQLKPGAELITRFLPFEAHLPKIDVLITGEGLTDNQTAHGKGPMYLAQQAKAHGAKVIILSGGLGEEYEALYEYVDALFSVTQRPVSLQDAMSNSVQWIEACAFNVGRLLRG